MVFAWQWSLARKFTLHLENKLHDLEQSPAAVSHDLQLTTPE